MKNIIENNFYNVCTEIGVSSSIKNSKFQLQQIFSGISLENKNILDVGGGSGYLSFYCKINGGRHVVCLEPEDEGSNNDKNNSFEILNDRIDYDIDYIDKRIEDYNTKKKFDLIILHNSINHLVDGNTKELSINDISNLKMMKTGYQRLSGSIGIRTPGPRDATKIGQVGRTSNYEDYLRAWNSRMRKFAVQRYYASLGKK